MSLVNEFSPIGGAISSHTINIRNGPVNLLEWVKDHKYRNYSFYDAAAQLVDAKKIAAVDDPEARKLMLDLLDRATRLAATIDELHKEFDTLHAALAKIDEK